MIECMLAAPSSGSGKTALACALLAALQKRGLAPCAFKCGPDYICLLYTSFRGGRLAGDGEPREIFENVSLLRTCGLEQPVLYLSLIHIYGRCSGR